jgi:CBS domain-containing protein
MADMQCRDITQYLTAGVQELGIGSYVKDVTPERPYGPIATATMQTTVFDVVHMFSELGISAVPIVDDEGKVLNLYETVDVIVSTTTPSNLTYRPSSVSARTSLSTSPSPRPSSSGLTTSRVW